jgi:hypothetical protein
MDGACEQNPPALSLVLVINVRRRADRFDAFMRKNDWSDTTVMRVDAFDVRDDPELGCFKSHAAAWSAAGMCVLSDAPADPWILVCEDDARPSARVRRTGQRRVLDGIAAFMSGAGLEWMQLHVPAGCAAGVRSTGFRCPAFSALATLAKASTFRRMARAAQAELLRCAGGGSSLALPLPVDAWLIWCFCRGDPAIAWCSAAENVFVPGEGASSRFSDIERARRQWWRPRGSFYEDRAAALLRPADDPPHAMTLFHRCMISFSTGGPIARISAPRKLV